MRILWYSFLALISLGLLGLTVGIALVVYVISYYGQDLPDYTALKDYKPPVVTRVYAGDGRLMAEYAEQKRVFVPIETMPDIVKQSFIAAEDKNFYSHEGVDPLAVMRAAISNVKNMGSGRRPEGASTITQQLAKNFLLTNEVSYERKIKEAILAFRMERAMNKDRLLELYLNEIYLGIGSYGIAAAALNYFNKSLEELRIDEAAFLAALPKAPNNYHPDHDHDAALARRNWVIGRLFEDGYINRQQMEEARTFPLQMIRRDKTDTVTAPYFAEEVRRFLIDQYGENNVYGGGLAVRTTINPTYQRIAKEVLRDGLVAYDRRHGWRGPITNIPVTGTWQEDLNNVKMPEGKRENWHMALVMHVTHEEAEIGFKDGSADKLQLKYLSWARKSIGEWKVGDPVTSVKQVLKEGDVIFVVQTEADDKKVWGLRQIPRINGAIMALDPHTGRILAMQGGWDYEMSEYNRATQAWRQPGSAFKPFVYLAALDKGFTPATLVLDAPIVIDQGPGLKKWRPSNYTKEYYGPTPIRVGIEKSRNLMTVRLASFVGMPTIAEYARRFGIVDDMPMLLANALGAKETTLLRLTTAYGEFVNGGKKITPTFIDRIQDRRGKTIYRHDSRKCPNCGNLIQWQTQPTPELPDNRQQIADPRKAYQIVSMMQGVIKRGTGVKIGMATKRPLAGKTGTTNESRDAWFIGFSPDLVVGIYAGFDNPTPLGNGETAASISVPIFRDFITEALKDQPAVPFRVPPGVRHVQINAETGARSKPGDEKVIWEAFLTGTEPTDKMYILDGKGISLIPSLSGHSQDSATTGTGGLY